MSIKIQYAQKKHNSYAQAICDLIAVAAKQRGTGIAKRDPQYIKSKIEKGNAVIALDGDVLVGFCYIETWEDKKYVANSGLIVNPDYRGKGIARKIKEKSFQLSREKFPESKLFGITTSLAVMKINSGLGYKPVTYSELTQDSVFWEGCKSCPNYDILTRNKRKNCLCTGMLFDPAQNTDQTPNQSDDKLKKIYRWVQLKKEVFLKPFKK